MAKKIAGIVKVPKETVGGKIRDNIFIKGARTHNLKNVTVEFPRNQLLLLPVCRDQESRR